jgi:hypothetical protein
VLTTDALRPQLTRVAMEAHLRLLGWVPCSWGACAARKGTLIVYSFYRTDLLGDSGEVRVLKAGRHNLKASELGPGSTYSHDVDDWWQSHSTFGCMARAILNDFERDRSDA